MLSFLSSIEHHSESNDFIYFFKDILLDTTPQTNQIVSSKQKTKYTLFNQARLLFILHFRRQLLSYIKKLKGGHEVHEKLKSTEFTISQCLVLIKSSVKFIDEGENAEIVFIEQFFKSGHPSSKIGAYQFLSILVSSFDHWWNECEGWTIVSGRDAHIQ